MAEPTVVLPGQRFTAFSHTTRGQGTFRSKVFVSSFDHGQLPRGIMLRFDGTTNNTATNSLAITLEAQLLPGDTFGFRYGPEVVINYTSSVLNIPILYYSGAVNTGNITGVDLVPPIFWLIRVGAPGSTGTFTGEEDWGISATMLV